MWSGVELEILLLPWVVAAVRARVVANRIWPSGLYTVALAVVVAAWVLRP